MLNSDRRACCWRAVRGLGADGTPDRRRSRPVQVRLVSDYVMRIDGENRRILARGVQGGVFGPSDTRNMEGLDSVPYGDDPRL
jgi:hypothetical protein